MGTIFRVQHVVDGRGPYRPGVTCGWSDPDGPAWPDIRTEFGTDWLAEIPSGWAAGCGFLTIAALLRWFTPAEDAPLARLGFFPVRLGGARVVRRGQIQVIFARRRPLTEVDGAMLWRDIRRGICGPLGVGVSACEGGGDGQAV